MSVLELRVNFFYNFASLFSARKQNSSVFFQLNFVCFGQKDLIKVQIFRLSTAGTKINQIPYVIFQATCQFSFKIYISVMTHNSSEIFLLKNYIFWTKRAHHCTIFQTFESSNERPPNSSNAIFETLRSQGLFNFCITVQCHER